MKIDHSSLRQMASTTFWAKSFFFRICLVRIGVRYGKAPILNKSVKVTRNRYSSHITL